MGEDLIPFKLNIAGHCTIVCELMDAAEVHGLTHQLPIIFRRVEAEWPYS